ncbi:MAG TPA: GHKL domain-containing protein [Crocinitomicaceae bacterium]|nr:GHKL domain-containing protein [Crocinitomicaceae bacterium]
MSIISTVVFIAFYFQIFSPNHSKSVERFNTKFNHLEERLDQVLKYRSDELRYGEVKTQWQNLNNEQDINIHIYQRDSLVFWNTNQLPIIRFADIHFPAEGIIHLQNGWYYAKITEAGPYQICGSFLIKNDYSFRNKDLKNDFASGLSIPFSANITLDEENGLPVFSNKKEFLFSIEPESQQVISRSHSILLLFTLLATISFWLFWIREKRKSIRKKVKWGIPITVIALRLLSLQFNWFGFLNGAIALDPSLYGANPLFPNFFEYLVNILVLIYLFNELQSFISTLKKGKREKHLVFFLYVLSFACWALFLFLTKGLIEHSSISLIITELFSLDIFSFLALSSLGVFFYSYFKLVKVIAEACQKQLITGAQLAMLSFVLSCIFFLSEINFGNQLILAAIFPLFFYELIIYLIYRHRKSNQLGAGIILLLVFSIVLASVMEHFNVEKERSERAIYAKQLLTEQDVITEIEYLSTSTKLKNDKFLKRFISDPKFISVSAFQEGLERRVFNNYWERYELDFHLFSEQHLPLIEKLKDSTAQFDELNSIVENSGIASEIDSNIFFIDDYTKQFNYIVRQEITGKDGTKAILFCTLKSKKIPEEIGFPRLLISSKSNVLEPLEAYSIARYQTSRLITHYGDFNYPSNQQVMIPPAIKKSGFFNYGKFNHYALTKSDKDLVMLSIRNHTFIDFITSFSYLFSLYGLLLMPLLFRVNTKKGFGKTLSLAMKIQAVLIALVFISLLAFGWGSGLFVTSQYNQLTNDVISEKLSSVQTEVKAKLGSYQNLSINENGDRMQYILQKFARVFYTDINLYDKQGYLLATSRPKVFNVGLLSEQMNPIAVNHLKFMKQSEFIQKENIGKLNYSSAYKPFYNNANVLMGFINLQHFGQQREFEHQIQKFLVAIINVFILLLAISIILAIFISNWLTSPLRIIQDSFANVKFGKQNEPISYDKEDEIGSLVKDYNRKLEELEFTAQQLAKSEREMAWREMAKQVAHEIKNPLTPMKLSVQQLLRTYDPNDPSSGDKLKKVANSIVEQIDALTKIANEFSSFAKMPNPSQEQLDLVPLIKGVKEVFENDEAIHISVSSNTESVVIIADRNQFIRVFNNLIKNAIQAIPSEEQGQIDINILKSEEHVIITVQDNGVGIDEAKQSKIFVPYFTTKSTGTGLGLAMVKQIIENHKGQIEFDSQKNKGTVFTITLPLSS